MFSLHTQRQIAHILSRAEDLVTARQRSLALLDDFLKSTFLNFFGDPVTNEKGWKKERLGELADITSGVTKNTRQEIDNSVEVPYMRVANVQDNKLDLTEIKTIDVSQRDAEKYRLQQDDILLTEGGDPDKLGRGVVWNNEIENCIHQNHIFRVRVYNAIEPHYLCTLIGSRYGKNYFLKAAKQTTGIASINLGQLKNFPAYIPDPKIQATFGQIANRVDTLKKQQRESLAQLQNLYQSLLQRVFAGEVDVSKVMLPGDEEEGFSAERAIPSVRPKRPINSRRKARKTKLRSAARWRSEDVVASVPTPVKEAKVSLMDQLTNWLGQHKGATFAELSKNFGEAPYQKLHESLIDHLKKGKITQYFDDETTEQGESHLRGSIKFKLTPTT